MNSRIAISALALALTLCVADASHAAAFAVGAAHGTTTSSTATKVKLVSFHLRNDAATSLVVQAGDQQMTIDPGKTFDVKLPAGMQLVAVNAAGHLAVGDIVATVSKELSGNTLVVN